jgi:hydrogenase 3 maturation protease
MRTVICGIGNSMKGDDSIGPGVINALNNELEQGNGNLNTENVMLLDCGTAPENFIGKITWFDPERVVIVDAVDMGKEPGTVEVIDTGKIIGDRVSTHKLPLSMFVEYLRDMFRKSLDITFIGAQPDGTAFSTPISQSGERAVDEIKKKILRMV